MGEAPKEILVSIILPTRNANELLRWTILSLLESTDQRFELLIVDNNFPLTIPNYLEIEDPRVKVVTSKAQLSMASNWHLGLQEAQGKWVMYVGSDDGIIGKNLASAFDYLEDYEKVADIILFRSLGFTYPLMGRNPWVEIPINMPSRRSHRVKSPKLLCALFPTQLNSLLPIPYGNAICKKTLLREILEMHESIPGVAPDYFLGFYLALMRRKQFFIDVCFPIRGLSQSSNGYQVLNGINTDNSIKFYADVKKSSSTEIDANSLKCRPGIAVRDYLLAKRLVEGREIGLTILLMSKLSYLTCIDGGHHEGQFHRRTLRLRKFIVNKFGYFLRKCYLLAAGISTARIRNTRVELESSATVYSVQEQFIGRC